MKLVIEKGKYKVEVPLDKKKLKSIVEVPIRSLRNRDRLPKIDRFQAKSAAAPKEPKSYKEAMTSPEADEWIQAMKDEMASMEENETWLLVKKPEGARVLDSKWVYKI